MDIIDDIRLRLLRMPVIAGKGSTIKALPGPEDIPAGTWVYRGPRGFMGAVRNPNSLMRHYARQKSAPHSPRSSAEEQESSKL